MPHVYHILLFCMAFEMTASFITYGSVTFMSCRYTIRSIKTITKKIPLKAYRVKLHLRFAYHQDRIGKLNQLEKNTDLSKSLVVKLWIINNYNKMNLQYQHRRLKTWQYQQKACLAWISREANLFQRPVLPKKSNQTEILTGHSGLALPNLNSNFNPAVPWPKSRTRAMSEWTVLKTIFLCLDPLLSFSRLFFSPIKCCWMMFHVLQW